MRRHRNPHIEAFDSEAEVLERLNVMTVADDDEQRSSLVDRLGLGQEECDPIVELGCGMGRLTGLLLERFPRARVIGIDGAPRLLEIARRRLGSSSRLSLVCSAFEQLDWQELPSGCAAVVVMNALEHVASAERRQVFSGVRGILRDGGVFLDREWSRDITPPGVDPFDRSRPEHTPESIGRAIREGRITEEEHWRLWEKLADPRTHHFMSVDEQLADLREAGFRDLHGEWLSEASSLVLARR
jgi:ubiquinone/menaquinone biosynthesis C-methylase UbiE